MVGARPATFGVTVVLAAAVLVVARTAHRAVGWWEPLAPLARLTPAVLVVVAVALAIASRWPDAWLALGAAVAAEAGLLAVSARPSDLVRSAALLAASVVVPALGALVSPRRTWPWWGLLALVGVAATTLYDPFADLRCATYCAHNQLLLHDRTGDARTLLVARDVAAAALGLAVAAGAVRRRDARGLLGGPAVACLAVGTALARSGRSGGTLATLGLVLLVPLAVAACWLAWERLRRLQRLRRLASEPQGQQGSLESRLRIELRDPTLRLAYPCEDGTLVAADGTAFVSRAGATSTTVTLRQRPVLVVEHAMSTDLADVLDNLGPAARAAAWNEALSADLRHQLADVTASRRRLLEASDQERRRVERDLHDGAQQGLLALAYDLGRLQRTCDMETADHVGRAQAAVREALQELRAVATGVYPALVDQVGLDELLQTLAERSARPLEIRAGAVRVPSRVAQTAHDLVSSALAAPVSRPAVVDVRMDGGTLFLDVGGPGIPLPTRTADRVESMGGVFHGDAERWEVRLPCAS